MKRMPNFGVWLAVVFGVSVFNNLVVTSTLSWYDGWKFPPLTAHLYLLIWIIGMLICGVILAIVFDGISTKQNAGKMPMPSAWAIIAQAAASTVYIVAGFAGGYSKSKMLYFSPNFMCDVINRYSPDTITDENRTVWLFALTVAHMLIFTAVSLYFYFTVRNREIALLKKGLEE